MKLNFEILSMNNVYVYKCIHIMLCIINCGNQHCQMSNDIDFMDPSRQDSFPPKSTLWSWSTFSVKFDTLSVAINLFIQIWENFGWVRICLSNICHAAV